MPLDVLAFYAALVIWAGLLVQSFRISRFRSFLTFGLLLLVVVNVRYFIDGQADSIAFFIGIYDVLDNVGVSSDSLPSGMATCPDNECTVWGDTYENHATWAVSFHDRFANGPTSRAALLYGHIGFNTIAFVLAHFQLARPGTGAHRRSHRLAGRIGFASVTLGTLCAVVLAAQHSTVEAYGGTLSMLGFWFMSFVVYGCAVRTVTTARSGDIASHRVWMARYLGSMWGAYWLFRVMLFVLHPLLRDVESAALLWCIWMSAPLGVVIAEFFRRRGASAGFTPERELATV